MKQLFFAFLLVSFAAAEPVWTTNFDKAEAVAKQSHKLILLSFSGSDWCGPCIRLHKEIFGSDAFKSYATQNLVLVNADFPRLKKNQLLKDQVKQNEALAEKYNNSGKFPFTVLLNENGKALKQWDGLPNETADQFVNELNNASHVSK